MCLLWTHYNASLPSSVWSGHVTERKHVYHTTGKTSGLATKYWILRPHCRRYQQPLIEAVRSWILRWVAFLSVVWVCSEIIPQWIFSFSAIVHIIALAMAYSLPSAAVTSTITSRAVPLENCTPQWPPLNLQDVFTIQSWHAWYGE